MQIKLDESRRDQMIRSIQRFFVEDLDREFSAFQAQALLDFFVRELGAPVYNQAIQDARAFVQEKLGDLEGQFYEPEEPYSR